MNLGLRDGGRRLEKVEIAPLVRLRYVLRIEAAEPPRGDGGARLPFGSASGELVVWHAQRQASAGDVERDHVAVADEGQRAPDEGFRGDVEHAGAVAGAAHPSVREAEHVAHALC